MTEDARELSRARCAIWVLALALHLLLLGLDHLGPEPRAPVGDEVRYLHRAGRILSGDLPELSSIWPPGYDFLIAPFLGLAGVPGVQLFQVLLWIAAGFLVWRIGRELLPDEASALLALGLLLLNPTFVAFAHYLWPEIPHLLCWLLVLQLLRAGPATPRAHGLLGLLLAAASLLKLVYLPVALGLVLLLPVIGLRRGVSGRAVILTPLVFLLLLAPVLRENHRRHGAFMIADSSVFNAWVGLNDRAWTDWGPGAIVGPELERYMASAREHPVRSRIYLSRIRKLLADRGVGAVLCGQAGKQYARLLDHRTFFTKQLPGGMNATYSLPGPGPALALRVFHGLIWALTLAGFGLGVVRVLRDPPGWTHALLALVGYNLGIFLVLHVKTRYVIQFLPVLCWISARGWSALGRRELSHTELGVGLLLSGALLGLAFRSLLPV